jgi:hypothetical protein
MIFMAFSFLFPSAQTLRSVRMQQNDIFLL